MCAIVIACSGKEFAAGDRSDAAAGGGSSDAASGGLGNAGASSGGAMDASSDDAGAGSTSAAGGALGSGGAASRLSDGTQIASAYDQACTFDGDCSVVTEGPICDCGACPNAAIDTTAESLWAADRASVHCPACGPSAPCPQKLAACANGACIARVPLIIVAKDYAATCRADSDCKVIPTGEVCSACACSAAAVNLTSYATYESAVAGVQCNPGPSRCNCAAPVNAHCAFATDAGAATLGACVLGP